MFPTKSNPDNHKLYIYDLVKGPAANKCIIDIINHERTPDVISTPSTQLLMDLEHLKEENDVMKIHLSSEVNKLQEANKMLRKKIKTMEMSSMILECICLM